MVGRGGEWENSVGREEAWTEERGIKKKLAEKCNVKMITRKVVYKKS
jgi:hypothetical protein